MSLAPSVWGTMKVDQDFTGSGCRVSGSSQTPGVSHVLLPHSAFSSQGMAVVSTPFSRALHRSAGRVAVGRYSGEERMWAREQ